MPSPTLDDLTVRRCDPETLEVASWLTRGRCATVFQFKSTRQLHVLPFLIPSYMQGITTALIFEAVNGFLAAESASVKADCEGNRNG